MVQPVHLSATTFLKQFTSGRTGPCVFECVDDAGEPAGEYVVKLQANMNAGATASMFEMIGALLADELGFSVPQPAIVEIAPELADGISDLAVRGPVRESAGLNFGSEFKTGGYAVWQPGRRVADHLLSQAFDVFAFDALIENPDRRPEKPNLLENGDEMVLIDHEAAFSFIFALGTDSEPWTLSQAGFLTNHVFFPDLKSLIPQFDRIHSALEAFTQDQWDQMEGILPEAWKSGWCATVRDHLLAVIGNLDSFIAAAKGKLL